MRIGGVLIVDQWSYREVAKRFYPGEPRMQRKWLRAYRSVTGPRVPIGTKRSRYRLNLAREELRMAREPVSWNDTRL